MDQKKINKFKNTNSIKLHDDLYINIVQMNNLIKDFNLTDEGKINAENFKRAAQRLIMSVYMSSDD